MAILGLVEKNQHIGMRTSHRFVQLDFERFVQTSMDTPIDVYCKYVNIIV